MITEGFSLKELLDSSKGFTFTADTEYMKPRVFDDADDLLDDEDGFNPSSFAASDKHMQVPQYHSFDDLATTMKDVEPTGAVKILMVEEGTGPLVPSDGYVKIHYAAYWENDDTPFDNSMAWNTSEPVRFKMGAGAMMPGLEIGLSAVHGPSAKFRLLLSPAAMFGALGAPPRIRPERALYCVSLVSVEDIGIVDRFTSLPSAEQKKFSVSLQTAEASNEHAKSLFKKRKYQKAVQSYYMSLEVLHLCAPEGDDQVSKIKELLIKVYTNLAVCYTKMDRPKKVVQMCDNLTRIGPLVGNAQALYLYGKAQARLGEYSEALKFLKMALKLQPRSEDIAREMAALEKKIINSKEQEKSLWEGAFSKPKTGKKFNVPDDFRAETLDMLKELSLRQGFVEFRLPARMTEDEVDCTKKMLEDFSNLCISEDVCKGERKLKIIKKE